MHVPTGLAVFVISTDVALSSDFIAGFCGETEADHQDTVSLIHEVQDNFAFCFPYSMREVQCREFHPVWFSC